MDSFTVFMKLEATLGIVSFTSPFIWVIEVIMEVILTRVDKYPSQSSLFDLHLGPAHSLYCFRFQVVSEDNNKNLAPKYRLD